MDEASGPEVEVWPCHEQALVVFSKLGTQWRSGMAGATGLDYSGVESALRMLRIPRTDWPGLFDDIHVMEQAALEYMHRDTKKG